MNSARIFQSTREDGRFQTSLGFCHHLIAHHKPKLSFDPNMSVGAFEDWRVRVREKLPALMGFTEGVPPQPVPEGLTMDEFFVYANVDAPNHCFKENLAVPWLDAVL